MMDLLEDDFAGFWTLIFGWRGSCSGLATWNLGLFLMMRSRTTFLKVTEDLLAWTFTQVLLFGGLDPCTQDRIDIGFKARTILFGLIQDLSRRFLHESLLVFCRPGYGSWFRGLRRCTRDTIIGSWLPIHDFPFLLEVRSTFPFRQCFGNISLSSCLF